ncbi:hypothetical protein TWF706_012001 [Orbilia oligospora]|nr:hypothetical protein TWF706_012001 [Orbilia oligospora]
MQSISPCKDMDMDHTSGKRVLSFPVATDSRPSSFDNPLPSKRARSNSPAFPIPPCRLLGIVTSRLGPNWPCDRDRILSYHRIIYQPLLTWCGTLGWLWWSPRSPQKLDHTKKVQTACIHR